MGVGAAAGEFKTRHNMITEKCTPAAQYMAWRQHIWTCHRC